jgi:hypothetical protein
MIAKEKADDLIKKMLGKNPNRQDGISKIDFIQAKLCALLAVDEILSSEPSKAYFIEGYWMTPTTYWQEVKQEIENFKSIA